MSEVYPPIYSFLTGFDEERYLSANPDVAQAVSAGLVSSGKQHYELYGVNEGRNLGLLSRRERMLFGIDLIQQEGIEIGALMTPIVKKDEAKILYVDHADTETVRKKYERDPNVNTGQIVDIDVVWEGGSLKNRLPSERLVHYILASHVVEHVPDLIRWLQSIHEVLNPSRGVLRLAVPDRRFTFDYLRFETRLHDILDAYLAEASVPTPHVVLDHCVHFRKVDSRLAWLELLNPNDLDRLFSAENYLDIAQRSRNGEYLDVHCWVFTPSSFASLMLDACSMGLINFKCSDYHLPQPFENEFIVGLQCCSDKKVAASSWREMLVASAAVEYA